MPRWTVEETRRLVEMLRERISYKEIAETLGRSKSTVKMKTAMMRSKGFLTEILPPIYSKNFCNREEKNKKPPSKEELYDRLIISLISEFEMIRRHLNDRRPSFIKQKPRLYNNLFRCAETLLHMLKTEPEESDIDEWAAIIAEKLPPEMVKPRKLLRRWMILKREP